VCYDYFGNINNPVFFLEKMKIKINKTIYLHVVLNIYDQYTV